MNKLCKKCGNIFSTKQGMDWQTFCYPCFLIQKQQAPLPSKRCEDCGVSFVPMFKTTVTCESCWHLRKARNRDAIKKNVAKFTKPKS